jgi:hypothetical protein
VTPCSLTTVDATIFGFYQYQKQKINKNQIIQRNKIKLKRESTPHSSTGKLSGTKLIPLPLPFVPE